MAVAHGGNQRQSSATGNPYGLRHLTAVALCRGTRPPHCLLYAGEPVHRNGLPSTTLAPQDRAAS